MAHEEEHEARPSRSIPAHYDYTGGDPLLTWACRGTGRLGEGAAHRSRQAEQCRAITGDTRGEER